MQVHDDAEQQAASTTGESAADVHGLRRRIVRVARVGGSHHLVVLGRAVTRQLPLVSRVTAALDGEATAKESLRVTRRRLRALQQRAGGARGKAAPRTAADWVADATYYLQPDQPDRPSVDALVARLSQYDVVSFDIFDTALIRIVEKPEDVFRILGMRLGIDDFPRLRRTAEAEVRSWNDRLKGSREMTLDELYDALEARYGVPAGAKEEEKTLELELSRPNPYIKQVYERLRGLDKRLVFMTDMYLPREHIEEMLARNGFDGYEKVYVSHEYMRRKGDGTLQQVLLENCSGLSVVHVGDNLEGDVIQSERMGLPAVHVPDVRSLIRENDMDSLAGSFYGAVINNTIGSGLWNEDLHYTHGFRVGGILALGYVEFLEQVAREKQVDRILFCGRDCDVLFQLYNEHFGNLPSSYVDVSRYALCGITLDRSFDEYIDRSFFRWLSDSGNSKPIYQLLVDTGFDYLVEHLAAADIDRFLFPASISRRVLEKFFRDHRRLVEEHNRESVEAAKQYFSTALGDAKRVLVVDIGWTGTIPVKLRHFFRTALPDKDVEVFGALMCTSRGQYLADSVAQGFISPYVYSPLANLDLARFVMPGGRVPTRTADLLHMPLEYLFTEDVATVTAYALDAEGKAVAVRGNNPPRNGTQIRRMQQGVLEFASRYLNYSAPFRELRPVTPYVAFNPLRAAIQHQGYSYAVYKDFLYDAAPALFGSATHGEEFGSLFETSLVSAAVSASGIAMEPAINEATAPRRILFVSPEMVYAGAPRSMLRLAKVARSLGFEPLVWTAKTGPFAKEFTDEGIRVHVVTERELERHGDRLVAELAAGGVELVVCNTIVTHAYVRALEGRLPLIWYVREATNLPDFFRSDPQRLDTLRVSRSVTCVSDYAAQAIGKFTDEPIGVVRNAVEDVSALAQPYEVRAGGVFRFGMLGTIEHRKGYDLLVAAYRSMPAEYRERAELHFAGGFINSATSFASYLFGQIEGEASIRYHGVISDEVAKVGLVSQMDAIVVASRDESCSLVALEGAMLAKPLIVTENVGAKYVVTPESGLVVKSGDVVALRDAMVKLMDEQSSTLVEMGAASRVNYEQFASMEAHRKDLDELFSSRIAAGPGTAIIDRQAEPQGVRASASASEAVLGHDLEVIVSLTSFAKRMPTIVPCIDSLLQQSRPADKVILWLSTENFPGREADLPAELLERVGGKFGIAWVDGDLAPHKKYFYAAQQYPDAIIITVDDDIIYDEALIASLVEAHLEQPRAIVCQRANLILFRPDGSLRTYDNWVYGCNYLRGTLTYQLLPTGVGGILYPPGSLPPATFDVDAIRETSLFNDDLWLKVMTAASGFPVWMPPRRVDYVQVPESQAVGLWRTNSFGGGNDASFEKVLGHFDRTLGSRADLLRRINGVADDRSFIGPNELDFTSLI